MSRHLGLLAVCTCIVASVGCDGGNPITPSPAPGSTVTVEFGGRVVNADAEGPVGNVRVSLNHVSLPSELQRWVLPNITATSSADGAFALAVNLPTSWRSASFGLTGPAGYDSTYWRVWPTVAGDRPAIRMYPTLVIRPGESVDVRVEGIEGCGWGGEAGTCRRVVVAASPGDPVELELVPDDSNKPMGLSPDNYLGAYEPVRRLMVPPGAVPYVVISDQSIGTAKLTARR